MKVLKWILAILAVLILLFVFVGMPYLKEQTKKHSPERTVTYDANGYDLAVTYSSPFKKERVIFGELVPYDEVWRTGANEPTTFTTGTDIKIADDPLPAGSYSLWTKPSASSWEVIFNDDIPDWGVTVTSGGRETTRKPDNDVVTIEVPVENLNPPEESFTIDYRQEGDQLFLRLFWDQTMVKVPINN